MAIDQAIRNRGMRPYFSLGGRAPDWATKRRGRRGTYRPSAKEFRLFAQAAGSQFPNVDIWSIWNEANLYSWLSPQRVKARARVAVDLPRPLSRGPSRPRAPAATAATRSSSAS